MDDTTQDRGLGNRAKYRTVQQVAFFRGEDLLPFVGVLCDEIGRDGFTFFADKKPHGQYLVCKLQGAESALYLLAEVSRAWPETIETGALKLRVECRFVGRLNQTQPANPFPAPAFDPSALS
jgi:hypothetical protein